MMTKQAELKKQAYASTLKSRALSVLIYLIDRSNKELTCFPAIPTMAEQLHISVSTVKRALHELLDSGYVKKNARFREKNKGQTSNLYTLVLFENGEIPDGGDGFGSKDCAEESELAEVKQEKADEAGQETCQVKHISFETLKRQREEVEKQQKAEVRTSIDTVFVEGCLESQRENDMCDFCDHIQVIRQVFSLRNGDKGFSLVRQDNERTMQEAFSDRFYRLLLYLWTGAGFSLMPPLTTQINWFEKRKKGNMVRAEKGISYAKKEHGQDTNHTSRWHPVLIYFRKIFSNILTLLKGKEK